MSHTNETTTLELPQFLANDKPTWLGDVNGAMQKIDAYATTNNASVEGAVTNASNALSLATNASETASTASNTAESAHTEAVLAEGVANNALTVANNTATLATAINTKVGDLEDLETTDKTSIVNAINEVAGGSGGTPSATNVTYDNTTSGLTATNVQSAIDELAENPISYNDIFSRMFDMTSEDGTFTPSANITNQSTSFKTAFNSDKTLGKIYGLISVAVTVSSTTGWTEVGTLARNIGTFDSDFYITGFSAILLNSNASVEQVTQARLKVTTTGTVTIEAIKLSTTAYMNISLPPCLLHFEDFGD